MKTLIHILACLLLAFSPRLHAQAGEAKADDCVSCDCAVMTCCPTASTPSEDPPIAPQRVNLPGPDLLATASTMLQLRLPDEDRSRNTVCSTEPLATTAVPIFLRNCRFLI